MNHAVENSLSLYERNFNKLTDLLPGLTRRQGSVFISIDGFSPICVDILEQNRYTSTVYIRHSLSSCRPWLCDLGIKVRIYHDAQVAEVIAYQGVHSLQPFYPYPNPKMRQPYEKRLVNLFLEEWLSYCLSRHLLRSG